MSKQTERALAGRGGTVEQQNASTNTPAVTHSSELFNTLTHFVGLCLMLCISWVLIWFGYNKNWGWDTDEDGNRYARTLSRNNYFKPYITLTDSYRFAMANGRSVKLSSTAYLALANGGGNAR